MGKKTIFAINTEVPGENTSEVNYRSNQTLLDADIILFTPSLEIGWSNETYQGKPLLSEHKSFAALEQTRHWEKEITTAVNAGKLVVVYLAKPEECFRYTGEKRTSGTGRNQKVTNIVTEINSYDALPAIDSYSTVTGAKIKIAKTGSIIAPYWDEFADYTSYRTKIEGKFSEVLLESGVGSRVVGAMTRSKGGGALLFLPPVDFRIAEFLEEYDEDYDVWNEAGLQAGKRFVVAIISLAEAISVNRTMTPPPDWASGNQYRLPNERHLEAEITQVSEKITHLEEAKNTLQQDLAAAGGSRHLLFEKGTPLEDAILVSLKLMGFKASGFDDGKSEFDAVFSAPEGRFIGEAEGRDNRAISIDKFSQLERNLHEDFSRDEIDEMAKGVLFGNGYRLEPPEERSDIFTEKCLTAAKRAGIALVRTPDMFELTRYLKEHPEDQDYATACRRAIADTEGTIVEFPTPPIEKAAKIAEKNANIINDTSDEIFGAAQVNTDGKA